VISGECHVETIPLGNAPHPPGGRKLAIDGLRLRLDLRIVPSAAGSDDAAAAAIWRIENAQLATLPLGILSSYRALAVAAGLAAMLLALGVWFVGAPGAPTTRGASEPSAARVVPAAAAPANPAPTSPASANPPRANAAPVGATSSGVPAVSAPSGSSVPELQSGAAPAVPPASAVPLASAVPGVAPRIAPTTSNGTTPPPAAGATSGAASVERAVRAPRGELAQPARPASSEPRSVRAAPLVGAAGSPPAAASSRSPAPAAANASAHPDSARDDMLDLFGDPK